MIVPLVTEETWMQELTGLRAFSVGNAPLVIVSPHPDDETLGAGGLIAAAVERGLDVLVVAVTDGEHAYADNDGLAATRRTEQAEAIHVLSGGKARLVRLGLTDSGVMGEMDALRSGLREYITAESHVIAPWDGDYHPDHVACGRAAMEVAREAGARLSWYFFWTWHRGTPADLQPLDAQVFVMNPGLVERKWNALECHRSQLVHESGEPILPEYLLDPAKRPFEVFATA